MVTNVSCMLVTFIPVSPQPHTESAQASQAICAHGFRALQSIVAGRQTVTCTVAPRLLLPDLLPGASGHRWTGRARHSCPGVGTIKAETSVLSQVFPSLYTCWEPSSSRNKSGSINCHCLAGEPPYLIPTPRALYFCIVGPAIIYTEGECGSGGGRDSA